MFHNEKHLIRMAAYYAAKSLCNELQMPCEDWLAAAESIRKGEKIKKQGPSFEDRMAALYCESRITLSYEEFLSVIYA